MSTGTSRMATQRDFLTDDVTEILSLVCLTCYENNDPSKRKPIKAPPSVDKVTKGASPIKMHDIDNKAVTIGTEWFPVIIDARVLRLSGSTGGTTGGGSVGSMTYSLPSPFFAVGNEGDGAVLKAGSAENGKVNPFIKGIFDATGQQGSKINFIGDIGVLFTGPSVSGEGLTNVYSFGATYASIEIVLGGSGGSGPVYTITASYNQDGKGTVQSIEYLGGTASGKPVNCVVDKTPKLTRIL